MAAQQYLALAVILSGIVLSFGQDVVVTVDPIVDNTDCVSAQELLASNGTRTQSTCSTVNEALGGVMCGYNGTTPEEQRLSGVLVRLVDGKHRLTECAVVWQSENIVFEAVNTGQATITCSTFPNYIEGSFDNLFVYDSTNVTFRGIRFEECGPVPSNVFLNRVTDVTFEDCTFFENQGSPLQFRFCTGVSILNSHFILNNNKEVAEPDVNETNIEDFYSAVTTSGGLTFFSRDEEDIEVFIQNCSFISNSANRNDPNNSRPVLLKQNGHGGAVLIRLVSTVNAKVTITDSTFQNNSAQVDGGAVYIFLSGGVLSSEFRLTNNRFLSNNIEQASGGAVSVNSFNFTFNNSILVKGCDFIENTGNAGGAFSVALYDSSLNSTRLPDEVNFARCNFVDNRAENEGTAVGLFSLVHVDQIGFPVSFTDCTFTNNTSLEDNQDTSAIAAFRFPTIFSGYNNFTGNIGGGITLLNTRMAASGTLWFERNTAVFGAGLAMDDRCLLEISPNTEITFLENTATESGAGIYVEFPPIRFVVDIFNRLCFLQYKDPTGQDVEPQNWENVHIQFIRNVARLSGAAIFASDMQQCGWLGNDFTTDDSLIFRRPVNLTQGSFPFEYNGNMLMAEGQNVTQLRDVDLATAPSVIEIQSGVSNFQYVQPGETVPINLLAIDQVQNSREAVWSLEAPSSPANLDALSANNNTHPYVVPGVNNLPGVMVPFNPDGTLDYSSVPSNFSSDFDLTFSLLRTLGTVSTLPLSVNGCHPGYRLDSSGQCVCDTETFEDILRCDDNNRYLYLREGIWGNQNEDRRLVTTRVQPGYVQCERQGRLQGCLFAFDDPDRQCRQGRKGLLCGQCEDGYAVTLDLQDCMDSTQQPCVAGLVVFILLCIGVVVGSLIVLVFDMDLPNELKGFFFYAQVIGLVYRPYQVVQDTGDQDTRGLSIVLNLVGFSVPIPLCLWEGVPAHLVALLGYIPPVLALLTVIGYVIAARYIGALGRHSALKALTFISLLSYKYVADTAFIFISCLPTEFGFVFQYDGSLQCISVEFGIFALIGLILVIFFVFPTPPFLVYICKKRPLRFQHYADVLTRGLKDKHRWWGGYDLGRRLPFVVIAAFTVYVRPSVILFLMSLTALTVLLIHVFTKPFEEMYINVIEAAILLNLLMVTAAFLDPSNSPVPFAFSTILVMLPYFYAAGYVLYRIGYKLWVRVPKVKRKVSDPPDSNSNAPQSAEGDRQDPSPNNTQRSRPSTDKATPQSGSSPGTTASTADSGQSGKPRALTLMGDSVNLREPLLED